MNFKHFTTIAAATAALALPLHADDHESGDIKPTGKAPSKAIQGYWIPDKDALLKAMMKKLPEEAKADETALAAMKGMIETFAGKMAFHFGDGKTEAITPTGVETSTWKVVSEDAKTGKVKVTITESDGSTEEGEAIVGKDKMIMINPKEDMQVLCTRITEEEYKKRLAAAKGAAAP